MEIAFTVEGIPRPQGSKSHIGRGIMVESSKYVANWRNMIREAARKAMQDRNIECQREKAVTIEATFYFERPKAHYTSKGLRATAPVIVTKKPDVDKLLRAVLDACSMVVYYDDCQVQIYQCNKLFTEAVPRAEIKFAFLKP